MYEEHSELESPSESAVLWRYIDLARFLSLLQTRSLHFARTDQLSDPFEGSSGRPDVEHRKMLLQGASPTEQLALSGDLYEAARRLFFVNCWHENPHESEAMWSLYATRDHGIALKTSLMSLRDSFVCDEAVNIGKVRHLDYDHASVGGNTFRVRVFRKRKSFEHDREVRAFTLHSPDPSNMSELERPEYVYPTGVHCSVDLDRLIEEIVIGPSARDWFSEVVEQTAVTHGLHASVRKSTLAADLLW